MKPKTQFLYFLFTALLLEGCAPYMTQSQNVSGQKAPYSKILVITRVQNRIARSLSEQDIAAALQEKGIPAVACLKNEIEVPMEQELSPEERAALKQELLDMGFDGVLVTHLVDTEQYKEVIPRGVYASTDPYNYGQFGYYWTYYPVTDWAPGTVVEGTRFELESAFYNLKTDPGKNLQWIGRFKLEDPEDIRKTSQRFAREVVNTLAAESISKR